MLKTDQTVRKTLITTIAILPIEILPEGLALKKKQSNEAHLKSFAYNF